MSSERAQAAIEALKNLGWVVRQAGEPRPLPSEIQRRYPSIPPAVRSFLEHLELCARGDDTVWFLTPSDYAGGDETGFTWDACERMELEDADARTAAEIRAFWNAHLPILLSVGGEYSYLAVSVDPHSANYGAIVEGETPDFREPRTFCASFDDLLEQIIKLVRGKPKGALAALVIHPHDERRMRSQHDRARRSLRFTGRLLERLYSWRLFERYRVGVVVERRFSRPLYTWENWSKIMPPLTAVISGIRAETVIRPRQAGEDDNWLPFGRLPWNEKNNRTWTTKYLEDPTLKGKVEFMATEIWAPSRAASFDARRGPELFCLLDRNEADDTQGFVLAIRKDMLRRVDLAADDTIFAVREFFSPSDCQVFDRRWGEFGRFGSLVVSNGLDWTGSTAVLHWAKAHRRHRVLSFRRRRSWE